jgi:hypothetical protein
LAALRLPQQNGEVHSIIGSLIKIVSTISELTQATCDSHYQYNCSTILSQLGKCAQRLSGIQSKYFTRGAVASATVKHDLAKEAYEIAKFTKELINLFESK